MENNVFHFFLHYIKQHLFSFFSLLVLCLMWPLLEALGPYFIQEIIDHSIYSSNPHYDIGTFISYYICLLIMVEISSRISRKILSFLLPSLKKQIRKDCFQSLTEKTFDFFYNQSGNTISHYFIDTANNFERILRTFFECLYPILFSFFITLFFIGRILPILAIAFCLWFMLMMVVSIYASKKEIQNSKIQQLKEKNLTDMVGRIFNDYISFKIYPSLKNFFIDANDREFCSTKKLETFLFRVNLLRSLLSVILLVGSLYYGFYGFKKNLISTGNFTFITVISLSSVRLIWWFSEQLSYTIRDWGKLKKCLEEIPFKTTSSYKGQIPSSIKGKIFFKNVSFAYPGEPPLFNDLTLEIDLGEKVGIVGFSGAGKTTFIRLLMGFLKPQSGTIFFDNQDIQLLDQDSLLSFISFIPQNHFLFDASIRDNITAGQLEDLEHSFNKACTESLCDDVIKGFREKEDSSIHGLSNGEKQRLLMARAFLKEAPILIMDEPTSSQDAISEEKIQKSLKNISANKTTIIISHRLPTLKFVDKILVFNKGTIVEQGTHETLLNKKEGLYKKLWTAQI